MQKRKKKSRVSAKRTASRKVKARGKRSPVGKKKSVGARQARASSRKQGAPRKQAPRKQAPHRVAEEARIFPLLRADHRTVSELFEQMTANAGEASPDGALFPALQRELEVHATCEERAVYPRLAEHEQTREIAEHSVKEHGEVRRLLEELATLSRDDEKFQADLLKLKQSVEQHVAEEETRMFALMRKTFDTGELDGMAEEFQSTKDKIAGDRALAA